MAKVTKLVDRLIPSQERTQVFTDADASSGDVLDFLASLGKSARLVRIETTGSSDLSVRRNVTQTIYPQRTEGIFDGPLHGQNINVAQGQEITDASVVAETIGPDNQDLQGPVKDLEVTWTTGNWTIVVS